MYIPMSTLKVPFTHKHILLDYLFLYFQIYPFDDVDLPSKQFLIIFN